MDPVKIGIIGIGNMGSQHAKWLKEQGLFFFCSLS